VLAPAASETILRSHFDCSQAFRSFSSCCHSAGAYSGSQKNIWMSTFAALLPAGHSALSATSRDLEMALRVNPVVTGSVPALERSRRERAATVEYLQDANSRETVRLPIGNSVLRPRLFFVAGTGSVFPRTGVVVCLWILQFRARSCCI
jgi:hypothetical protein